MPERPQLTKNYNKDMVAQVAEQPRTAYAMAILNCPIGGSKFWEESGFPINNWVNREKVTLDIGVGIIVTAETREYILENITEEELKTAHEDSITLLTNYLTKNRFKYDLTKDYDYNLPYRQERLRHSTVLDRTDLIKEDVSILLKSYRDSNIPVLAVNLLKAFKINPLDMPSQAQQDFMWAYGEIQKRSLI